MSCFVVSENHIHTLVHARRLIPQAKQSSLPCANRSTNELGRLLLHENYKSYWSLYPKEKQSSDLDMIVAYDYSQNFPYKKWTDGEHTFITLIKAIHCFTYQCSNSPTWVGSQSQRYCVELLRELTCIIPGYAEAPYDLR